MLGVLAAFVAGVPPVIAALIGGSLTLLTRAVNPKRLYANVVSIVPAVMVMKSLVPHLPNTDSAWLTLAVASTLAGNLTLPGSLATTIVIERAKGRASISFFDFLKVGIPTGVASLAIGAAWLAFVRR